VPPVPVRSFRVAAIAAAILSLGALAGCGTTSEPEAPVYTPPPVQQPQVPAQPAPPPQSNLQPPPMTQPGTPPAKVALLLPLSGQGADAGQALLNAAQIAVFDFPDAHLTLMPQDTHGTPSGAAAAARQAVADGAELILGPLFAADARAAAPIAAGAGINEIAFSTDSQVAGGNVYLIGFLPEDEVKRVVSYAAHTGAHRFAALLPNTGYGQRVGDILRAAVSRNGATLGSIQTYDPTNPQSMTDAVKALTARASPQPPAGQAESTAASAAPDATVPDLPTQPAPPATADALGFDALLIADGGDRLHTLAPILTFYGINAANIRLLGTGLWDDPGVQSEAALVGGWFAGPPQAGFERFAGRYQDAFGAAPPRIASLGYDATALAAVLARNGPPGQRFSTAALTDPRGFTGIDGLFRLQPTGLPQRELAVLEVRGDSFQVVDPAPTAFGGGPSAGLPGGGLGAGSAGQQFGQYGVQDQAAARGGAEPVAFTRDQPVGGQGGDSFVAPR
jgi:ABC-type branched-subunit amino acid transport system substrate-binding protein